MNDNLEKQLNNLPQAKLSWRADWKIRFRLYRFMVAQKFKNQIGFGRFELVGRMALTTAVIVMLLVTTSIYAYAGEGVTQGHPLYPLKRALETLETKAALSPEAKVKTYTKFSERRLQEALTLSQKSLEDRATPESEINHHIEDSLDEAVANFNSAINNSQQPADQKNSLDNSERFREKEKTANDYLKKIEDNAEVGSNGEVLKKIKEVRKNIRRYQLILGDDESETEDENETDFDSATSSYNQGVKGRKEKGGRAVDRPETMSGSSDDQRPEVERPEIEVGAQLNGSEKLNRKRNRQQPAEESSRED